MYTVSIVNIHCCASEKVLYRCTVLWEIINYQLR